ncbi:UDP-GlcNAc:betaGal beta-1,3-N-acetylglucosaminyltransferase-like protein 1 [Cephus cinctus]|uniref:UDP-GlcNAc:betaGal beta-1,3-N-acetylglucosaminyltransferase-like protein 1 n=1 Tax=Cephus cinctus TaxID=211228 RepID=A0AAJ7RJQ1_CEPCN|nr:UDP-GlcNAc:betaGal beta-1,3-N-acetylglucosaminyltransferase-like protein 1 [Cephus cinctus]
MNIIKFDIPLVSVIIPIYNGRQWIDNCFQSILQQTCFSRINLEISVCDDASDDETPDILETWRNKFKEREVILKIYRNESGKPQGETKFLLFLVGYAKNRAVKHSTGEFLCFQDVDDRMLPIRIEAQYAIAKEHKNAIVGGRFIREPENSTLRFTRWANHLEQEKLTEQIYTSHGPTVVMPTWFLHRNVFDRIGGFSEEGHGTPEDLIFFYAHLDANGIILRTEEPVVIYVYHTGATTFSIEEKTIWDLRINRLQNKVLSNWKTFTIWNAGKQGRRFFHSLKPEFQKKVFALCDVDKNKIGSKYEPYDPILRKVGRAIPILHYTEAKPPFVICIKLDMSNGEFESNLGSLNLREGLDFVLFN